MLETLAPVRPVIPGRYHAEVLPGEAVAFIGENGIQLIDDPAAQQVIPLIDGHRSTADIAALLAPLMPAATVQRTLGGLVQARLVTEAADVTPAASAFWSELGVPDERLPELLAAASVALDIRTTAPFPALFAAIADLGLRATTAGTSAGASATVRVVAVDDYLDPGIAEVDMASRRAGQPWLLVKPTGVNVWVGPLFSPGRGACWQCLAVPLRRNRPVDAYLYRRTGRVRPLPTGAARAFTSAAHAAATAATRLAQWIAVPSTRPAAETTLTILETLPLVFSTHAVLRRPQCPACGDPSLATSPVGPPSLTDGSRVVHSLDGGEHTEPPEDTYARYAHLVSPVTGAVNAVVPSPWNIPGPLRSYVAGHNYALSGDTLRSAAESLRTYSSGKGRSDAQARTSALCEALERLSGVYTGAEPRRRESLNGLGEDAVDPRSCLLFSERQYAERARWLASGSHFQVVPHLFDPSAQLDWSPLWSLTESRVRWLPTSYLYFGFPHDESRFVAWADSNGNAAGATFAQACLQGFYELVERDAVAIWWYNRIPRPGVDLESLGDPWLDQLREFYAVHDREFWVLDLTTDLEIPACAAISRRVNGPSDDIVLGFGAHHNLRIAVMRAITEMNQFMPAVLDVAPDGIAHYRMGDRDAIRWWLTAHAADQPYVIPLSSAPLTRLSADAVPPMDAAARFRACVASMETRGHEVLVLDQTRPDLRLPVAKVVVPGLRHFWARFAPGRLYDVPVELGWLSSPTPEDQLNPTSMFL